MKSSTQRLLEVLPSPGWQSRRWFLQRTTLGAAALSLTHSLAAQEKVVQGFERRANTPDVSKDWQAISDRKIRVGIVGYGFCKFGADFGFQDHPNVEIVAVSDLLPDRCAGLAKACRCEKTYPSLEELVKDDRIEAVFVAGCAQSCPPLHRGADSWQACGLRRPCSVRLN